MSEDTIDRLVASYLPKVIRLAEFKIAPGLRHRIEPEDLGGSVMRTVFRRKAEGRFHFEDEESLWKQLVVITLRRVANKVRDAKAQKRGGGRATVTLDEMITTSESPDPSHAAELLEIVSKIGEQLDDVGRCIFEMRMAGYDHAEIAAELKCSTKTIQRKVNLIKQLFSEILNLPDEANKEA